MWIDGIGRLTRERSADASSPHDLIAHESYDAASRRRPLGLGHRRLPESTVAAATTDAQQRRIAVDGSRRDLNTKPCATRYRFATDSAPHRHRVISPPTGVGELRAASGMWAFADLGAARQRCSLARRSASSRSLRADVGALAFGAEIRPCWPVACCGAANHEALHCVVYRARAEQRATCFDGVCADGGEQAVLVVAARAFPYWN